jgi:hypothetical protein
MGKSDLWGKLKSLDAYPKVNEDFFTKTMSGGIITIVSSLVMAILFISELSKCASAPPHRTCAHSVPASQGSTS